MRTLHAEYNMILEAFVRDPKKIFKTQALLCTDINASAEQIIQWFVRRWQVEVTFHEVRTHLGVETQKQSV